MAENSTQYKDLCRAQLSYDYLHTNSTTHEFLFGALAELLDNARDASATKINIYSVPDTTLRGNFMLCFLDDGQGMSGEEAADIVTFGKSSKKSLESQIGMYGNGLKSGSMRIGNDFILFTKKGPTMTCIFLSRTFHDEEGIDEIVVPMPSFDSQTKKPLLKTAKDKERHQIEMDLILKYSPLKTEAAFMKEFDKIEGTSGTLVNVYNVKLLDSGEPELDVQTDPFDIILTNSNDSDFDADERLVPERKSFRAYTSIMYVDPRMRVFIQGKKVRTQRLANSLYKPRVYKYSSARFKARSEAEVKKALEESRIAENRAREAESKARNLEGKIGASVNKDQRAELRRMQNSAAELRKDAQIKKAIAERKQKALRDPKSLSFVFGINIDSRNQDGIFVYNCSRLIKMYQKVGPQADGGVFCSGVVGFVDVPYLVLEPTHNKQDFADAKEYRHLLTAMGEHMTQYWKDINIASQGVSKFWESFGYISANWRDPPSSETKYVRKRAMQIQVTIQCDLCLKWRILPFSSNNIGKSFPDDWVCSMNSDPAHNRCSAPEEKLNMPEGVLKKVIKTKEDKERDLAEEIRKKQEQLDKLNKSRVVSLPTSKKPSESEESSEESEEEEEEEVKPKNNRRSTTSPRTAAAVSNSRPSRDEPPKRQPVVEQPKPKPAPAPPARSAAASKPSAPPPARPPPRTQKRGASTSKEESEEEELPVKRRAPAPAPAPVVAAKSRVKKSPSSSEEEESESEEESAQPAKGGKKKVAEPDDGTTRSKPVISHHGAIGTRVEIRMQTNWIRATVVDVNPVGNKWKIRQDSQATDKFDKWFDKTSPDVRLVKIGKIDEKTLSAAANSTDTTSVVTATPAQSSSSSPATAQEVSAEASSSSPGGTAGDISNLFRTCLRYFLPPQWVMDKEAVSNLSLQELATFPLDDFFDYYERGLKKLVSGFQLEAQNRQSEAEHWKSKLSSLRKMIAKLLKSINDDFDIDQDTDTEQVDELLSLCVKQALQQGQGDDGTTS